MQKSKIPFLLEEELVHGARIIIDAVSALHNEGFIHGQINLQSVLLGRRNSQSNIFKVALSKTHRCQKSSIFEEFIDATPHISKQAFHQLYLAPEYHAYGSLGKTSDIWSLGVSLFVLATGYLPFSTPEKILQDPLSFPSGVSLKTELKTLLSCMLSKEASARPSARKILQSPWFIKFQQG